jgi:4-hydroxy-3-methylbut-2-enyl diphosphate reductase
LQVTKKVLLAGPRGFCAGVDRAVTTVERALATYGAPIYVRHEIVHNKHVVSRLRGMGAVFVDEVSEVPFGQRVIFSAHGVSPAVRLLAAERQLSAIDATCPLVTKVHKEVVRFAKTGFDIILIGHAGHEEVEGTAGEAPEHVQVVSSFADIDAVQVKDPTKVVWLSQTTLSVDEAALMVARLRDRFPELSNPPSDDICFATQNRQDAVKAIAAKSDIVVVVGSVNSSNSVRLVEVALQYGARNAYRIDDVGELDPAWLQGVETVGVTSGASVPEKLVTAAVARLREFGFDDVEVVQTATENTRFALPRELNN